MFKKAKWTLWLALFLALSLLFVACMLNNDEPNSENLEAATLDNQPSIVRLGFIGPITGPDAAEGLAARDAFMLAVEEANAAAEFPFLIEVVPIDDQSSPKIALLGVERLLDDELVVAVAGFWNAETAAVAIPKFVEHQVPLIIWGAAADQLVQAENLPWVLRVIPSTVQESAYLSNFVLDELGYEDWFLVSDLSLHGASALEAFRDELALRGIEPLGLAQVPENYTDLSSIVQQISESGAQAVFSGANATLSALLKLELDQAGIDDIIFTATSVISHPSYLYRVGSLAEGTLIAAPGIVLADDAKGSVFLAAYSQRDFNEAVSNFTPYAYEAALIIFEALRGLGEITPQTLAEQILEGEASGIMGNTSFDQNGQTTNNVFHLQVVQNGHWLAYEKSVYLTGGRSFGGQTRQP